MFNPYDRKKQAGFVPLAADQDVFRFANPSSSNTQEQRKIEKIDEVAPPVEVSNLPRHLFTPEGARSVDIRNLASIPAATSFDVLVFTAPEGATTFFTHYAIFNDALDFSLVEFIPTVNNRRIYPYHGEPSNNYKIALGLAPDLSNSSLIEGPLQLNPGEVLRWTAVNNAAVAVAMGVRMKGYLDARTSRKPRMFGG